MYTLAKGFLVYSHLLIKGILNLTNKKINNFAFLQNNLLQTVLKGLGSGFLGLWEDAKLILE